MPGPPISEIFQDPLRLSPPTRSKSSPSGQSGSLSTPKLGLLFRKQKLENKSFTKHLPSNGVHRSPKQNKRRYAAALQLHQTIPLTSRFDWAQSRSADSPKITEPKSTVGCASASCTPNSNGTIARQELETLAFLTACLSDRSPVIKGSALGFRLKLELYRSSHWGSSTGYRFTGNWFTIAGL